MTCIKDFISLFLLYPRQLNTASSKVWRFLTVCKKMFFSLHENANFQCTQHFISYIFGIFQVEKIRLFLQILRRLIKNKIQPNYFLETKVYQEPTKLYWRNKN